MRKKMIVKGKAYEENIVLNKNELAKCFAPRKYEIREAMAELRCNKELPLKNADYKPNYEAVRKEAIKMCTQLMQLIKSEAEKKNKISLANDNLASFCNNNTDIIAMPQPPIIDIINNLYLGMLKQIILCNYKHILPNTDSDASSFVAVTKQRKNFRRPLTLLMRFH
jgi:hypothetical protein